MWKQETIQNKFAVVDERLRGHAVVAGLVVFEAEVRDLVAERDEEVIRAIVAALIESAGLAHQLVELCNMFL